MTLKNMKDPCSDPGNSRILIRAKILCDYKKCFRAEFSTPVKECIYYKENIGTTYKKRRLCRNHPVLYLLLYKYVGLSSRFVRFK